MLNMTKTFVLVCALSHLLSGQSRPIESDTVMELRREIDSLKQGQKKIQKDLSAVLDILSGKTPPLEDVYVARRVAPRLDMTEQR